jgi:hypothetical protein
MDVPFAGAARTVRIARCMSPSSIGWRYFGPSRYFSTKAATPSGSDSGDDTARYRRAARFRRALAHDA